MADVSVAADGRPGWRELPGVFVATLRHFAEDTTAGVVVAAQGGSWPVEVGRLVGNDPWLAWRGPQETLLLTTRREPVDALLQAMAPGQSETAMAAELSDSLMTWELHGAQIDDWLTHLVDASAVPRQPGRATRARMADVAVLLLRLAPERLWLLADRSIAAYVSNWLAFGHEGAFGGQARRP
jgi:sarcosine oxidase gamma subunit